MSGARMLAIAAVAAGAALSYCDAHAQSLTTLYSFTGGADGAMPYPGLMKKHGTLYGTTTFGGSQSCPVGCGTVYSVTRAGSETVLHAFTGGTDGAYPGANLINVRGNFYGTTDNGGDLKCNQGRGCGTVFSVTPNGVESVLHTFKHKNDGEFPEAGLANLGGKLYGTTTSGGAYKHGTVYSITLDGHERVLYSFKGGSDGSYPEASLTNVNGVLYGTTTNGGGGKCPHGCGTVFTVTPSGVETVLHAFNGKDGAFPAASLINVSGTLYSTTGFGGNAGCTTNAQSSGCGTVFSITSSGVELVLHSFAGGADGANPYGLTLVNGTFYGTTVNGGGTGCFGFGCGTLFQVVNYGFVTQYSTLSSFNGGNEAANPYGLVQIGRNLYGTSLSGGTFGEGTVFEFTP
jgi:uncharacterized repeat protein (TIGR03803 family)